MLATVLLFAGCRGATEVEPKPGPEGQGERKGPAGQGGAVRATESDREVAKPNQRPVVLGVWIKPDPPTGSEPIKATVRVWDKEGDKLSTRFAWFVNGDAVDGVEGDVFPRGRIKREDTLKLVVQSNDGKQLSEPREGAWKVVNGPPVITTSPPVTASLKEPLYTYAIAARDPDGDAVTFVLKEGPAGMTVNPKTGHLAWTADSASLGVKRRAVVAAKDEYGAETTQAFSVTVSEPKP
ncbi:MAG: hypothetical protein A2V83_08750 [Nitrospirae bacterium RBG_16_64_22]|nr:MAG: hypothetical protein A2V83_08750 [Nitrospirae bacterium RBG_16_64_22]